MNAANAADPAFRCRGARSLELAESEVQHSNTLFPSKQRQPWNVSSDTELGSIIEKEPTFAALNGRTHAEIRAYLDLSDGEFTAIQALRHFLWSPGIDTLCV